MRKTILATLLILSASIYAQTYDNQYGIKAFSTPESASTFVGSFQTSVAAYTNIIPTETWDNNYLYGAPFTVSWLVTYTPTQSDPVTKVPSSGAMPPSSIWGEPSCGGGLSGWTADVYLTQIEAKAAYDALPSLNKQTAYLLCPIGTLRFGTPNHYWLLVYMNGAHYFCY